MRRIVTVEIEDLPVWAGRSDPGCRVFFGERLSLDRLCVIEDVDMRDWTDDEIDSPDMYPDEAKSLSLGRLVYMDQVQQIIENLRQQLGVEGALEERLCEAIEFFLQNDAFVTLE